MDMLNGMMNGMHTSTSGDDDDGLGPDIADLYRQAGEAALRRKLNGDNGPPQDKTVTKTTTTKSNSSVNKSKDETCTSYSKTSLMDHMKESAGGTLALYEIMETFLIASSGDNPTFDRSLLHEQNKSLSALQAQHWLYNQANEQLDGGNPVAQYALGKLLREPTEIVFGKGGCQKEKALKLFTSAALKGNGLAMAALATEHQEINAFPTAVHWWKRALSVVQLPEAAFNIALSHVVSDKFGIPKQYECAAKHYAHAANMNLPRVDNSTKWKCFDRMNDNEMNTYMTSLILIFGPINVNQVDYQNKAIRNLRGIKRRLAYPHEYPASITNPPPFSNMDATRVCAMCCRRVRIGEKELVRCSRCQSVCYCNSICQKGDWPKHKMECKCVKK